MSRRSSDLELSYQVAKAAPSVCAELSETLELLDSTPLPSSRKERYWMLVAIRDAVGMEKFISELEEDHKPLKKLKNRTIDRIILPNHFYKNIGCWTADYLLNIDIEKKTATLHLICCTSK